MLVLYSRKSDSWYCSKTFVGLTTITGTSTNTLRRWLDSPETAKQSGYYIIKAEYMKSKQGGNRPKKS